MKTANKILLLVAFVMLSVCANAQLRVSNWDRITNSTNGSAFLDASSSSYNTSVNLGKGLVFPRVDLSVFTFSPTSGVGAGSNYPNRFDGMIVYNIKEGGTAMDGSTEGELTRGFWYYDNSSTTLTGGTWKPLGSGVAVADTPANGDVKYEGGGLYYWGDNKWNELSGQGLVPPTHDPNITVGLTGGGTEIMVGETIALTSNGTGVIWHIAQSDDYAELNGGSLTGLAPGIVTVRATTADNRYNEFTVTVKSANNPDGSGNLTVGSNAYKTFEYSGVTWMVTNSKEGTPSAKSYSNDNVRVNGYYYTWAQAATACPTGWRLPAQTEWNSLATWVNNNKTSEGAKFWVTDAGSAFAGYCNGSWNNWGSSGYWWGAASGLDGYAYTGGMYVATGVDPSHWFSVRCVKN